jgi:hypothetical protein
MPSDQERHITAFHEVRSLRHELERRAKRGF